MTATNERVYIRNMTKNIDILRKKIYNKFIDVWMKTKDKLWDIKTFIEEGCIIWKAYTVSILV